MPAVRCYLYGDLRLFLRFMTRSCVCLVISVLALLACSEDSNVDTADGALVATFDGSWLGPCVVSDDAVDATRQSLVIAGASGLLSLEQYQDTGCVTLSQQLEFALGIEYGNERVLAESGLTARALDFVSNQVRLTLFTENGVAEFNALGFCGIGDYALGVSAVLPLDCPDVAGFTAPQFQLAAIGNGSLFFGDAAGLTPNERPEEVNLDRPFVPQ